MLQCGWRGAEPGCGVSSVWWQNLLSAVGPPHTWCCAVDCTLQHCSRVLYTCTVLQWPARSPVSSVFSIDNCLTQPEAVATGRPGLKLIPMQSCDLGPQLHNSATAKYDRTVNKPHYQMTQTQLVVMSMGIGRPTQYHKYRSRCWWVL